MREVEGLEGGMEEEGFRVGRSDAGDGVGAEV